MDTPRPPATRRREYESRQKRPARRRDPRDGVRRVRGGELGPRILALSAYSRALARYQGGIPQVAFHAYERLGAPLGTASSHGCVRMAQATLTRLLKWAPRGTPVRIRG